MNKYEVNCYNIICFFEVFYEVFVNEMYGCVCGGGWNGGGGESVCLRYDDCGYCD